MKKLMLITLLLLTSISLIGCNNNKQSNDIVTTLFPHYDIAKNVVGDKMTVSLLTNPGIEVHDFSPSSKQMTTIKNSKMFLFTSYEIDIWLNFNEKNIIGENTVSLDMSEVLHIDEDNHKSIDIDHDHDHNHGELHYWTDPLVMIDLTLYFLENLIVIDNTNKDYYLDNANKYISKINNASKDLETFLEDKENKTLYFSGHNALQGFEERFGLKINALSETSKPDADITSNQILNLLNEIKNNNIHFLFTEELSDPKIPNTIKNELKRKNYSLELRELHAYHNLTKEDFSNNITYYQLLERNISFIKEALLYDNFRG